MSDLRKRASPSREASDESSPRKIAPSTSKADDSQSTSREERTSPKYLEAGTFDSVIRPVSPTRPRLMRSYGTSPETSTPSSSDIMTSSIPEEDYDAESSSLSSELSKAVISYPANMCTAGGPFLSTKVTRVPSMSVTKPEKLKLDDKQFITINVGSTLVKGIRIKSCIQQTSYCSFLGIPYAQPPIDKLRFKPPCPVENCQKIIDATKERNYCIQQRFNDFSTFVGGEDCLYLNIHVPMTPSKIPKLLAVMVYIHGGGFYYGSGNRLWHSPDFLMKYYVIVVTFNYRLHILGFLNLEQSYCPGNMGLKDQVMALRWIQKNIQYFGGDPNNVTIFGSSAGATCVQLHMLSPLSKGLFHKAIMQSGNVYTPWGLSNNTLRFSMEVVKKLKGSISYPSEMLKFLQNQPLEKLVKAGLDAHYKYKVESEYSIYIDGFGPVVECYTEGAFLPCHPNMLKGNINYVPVIVGLNSREGLLQNTFRAYELKEVMENLGRLLSSNFNAPIERCDESIKMIKSRYLKKKEENENLVLVNFFTDIYFYRFYEAIELIINDNYPIFMYEFNYDGQRNLFKKIMTDRKSLIPGAAHSDELCYLFSQRNKYKPIHMIRDDAKMTDRMCNMWANFAISGRPMDLLEEIWPPFTESNPCYLRIDKQLVVVEEKLYEERFEFMKQAIGKLKSQH